MEAMTGESIRRQVTITNPHGFHMRPIQAFVEAANRFNSAVQLAKEDGPPVNGKSVLNLLGLAAEKGTVLSLLITGPDCEDAARALVEVLERNWTEDEN
jgi:phosphocarrier protein